MSFSDTSSAGRTRRFFEGGAAVTVWMTIGMVFHASPNAYLLVGIPVTIVFQRYVRRAPFRAMWVKDSPPFRVGMVGTAVAIGLMIAPLSDLVILIRSRAGWILETWYLVAILGAWPAAYALRYFRPKRSVSFCSALSPGVLSAVRSWLPPQPVRPRAINRPGQRR
jgi:hypothetical protein